MENPGRLEENVEQLMSEKLALVSLKDKIARKGERGKQEWLQKAEGNIYEIDRLRAEVAQLKEGSNPKNLNVRMKLNNKVIQCLKDVKVLQASGSANSEMIETLLSELATDKPKEFSSGDLRSFTSNFSSKIGSGAFGGIYKGQFPNGVKIAVKVLLGKDIAEEIFMAEVSTTGKIYHRYLVKLYGFCFDEHMKALVYEYMENGSLDKILYEKQHGLDWDKLYEIAIETAKGLAYLHDGCHVQIIHHDVKASNILLDSVFSPKITDFGLAKLLNRDKSHRTNTRTRGTPGYAAPEMWIPSSPITYKCDVYSFGMLLFEILGTRINSQSKKWFPKQVWEKFEIGQLDETIIDWGIAEKSREKAKTLCMVALWCAQYTPQKRPPMSTVVKMLEKEIPVPMTPPNPFIPSSESSMPPLQVSWHENRVQESASTSETLQNNTASDSNSMLEMFEKKCPPGGENSVIIYTSTQPHTVSYKDSNEVLSILRSHQVKIVERDFYSGHEIMLELRELLGRTVLPALFVKGRFIGGANEVKKLEKDGKLIVLFADVNKE